MTNSLSSASNIFDINTFNDPLPQNFTFPTPIIRNVLENAAAWKKLIQTCKYFFAKFPVYPLKSLKLITVNKYCKKVNSWKSFSKWDADGDLLNYDIVLPQIWLYKEFVAEPIFTERYITSRHIRSFGRCEIRILSFRNQNLTINEYQILTSSRSFEKIKLDECNVRNLDGIIVTLDKLLENIKNIEELHVVTFTTPEMYNFDTAKKLMKILPRYKNLRFLYLEELPGCFDFSEIRNFVMNNETIKIEVTYSYEVTRCVDACSHFFHRLLVFHTKI